MVAGIEPSSFQNLWNRPWPFLRAINNRMLKGVFPCHAKIIKNAVVSHLDKECLDKNYILNYRLVRVLSTFSKTCDEVIKAY